MKYIEQIRGQNHGASQLYQRLKNMTMIDVAFVIRTLVHPQLRENGCARHRNRLKYP